MKPAMAPESSAFRSRGVHVGEMFEGRQFFENCFALLVWKLVEELPDGAGPDDPAFHRFLLFALFARDIFKTSL